MPPVVLGTRWVRNTYLLTMWTILWGRHFYPYCTDEKTDDTKAAVICPHSQSQQAVELESELRLIWLKSQKLYLTWLAATCNHPANNHVPCVNFKPVVVKLWCTSRSVQIPGFHTTLIKSSGCFVKHTWETQSYTLFPRYPKTHDVTWLNPPITFQKLFSLHFLFKNLMYLGGGSGSYM